MTENEAHDIFEYNDWANARLLARCAELSADQWSQELGGSFPTLLRVVAHVVGGEWIWLQRWKGDSPTSAPDWFTDPSALALRSALADVQTERRQFLQSLTKEDLEREIQYTLLDGSRGALPLSTLLRHAMNHSTYHRGQIAAMLRQLNVAPPPTDLLVYAMERRATGAARVEDEIIRAAHDWDRAMVTNDPDEIGSYMADEWTIIGPDGSVGTRARFLELVRSGELTHDVMESHDMHVRVYGETAVVTARGISGGLYRRRPFHLVERVSCVFVRQQQRWKCVLTHLSLMGGIDPGSELSGLVGPEADDE